MRESWQARKNRIRGGWVGITALAVCACSAPKMDGTTLEGKAAILDTVNSALTNKDCATAITWADTIYNTPSTDNQVRLARASAYGCAAGVDDFFGLIGTLPSQPLGTAAGQGSFLWRTLAKLFAVLKGDGSIDTGAMDKRITAGWASMDALMSTLSPGVLVSTANQFNATTVNPGSLAASDRTGDADLYMFLITLSQIGAIEDRYGAPDTTSFKKGQKLGQSASAPSGWEDPLMMDVYGCTYASSLLNLFDSLGGAISQMNPKLSSAATVMLGIRSVVDLACNAGCIACGLGPSACSKCPDSLKDRNSCAVTGGVANKEACAASGIISFINDNTNLIGWEGP